MRTRSSCRFDPYYKVQVWSDASLAWMDIQRSYPTQAEAEAAAPRDQRHRLMLVTVAGRQPVNVS